MRLYLDEDSQWKALIQALRDAGHDVLTTAEADKMAQPDSQQLEFAALKHRVILTANRHDYARLHHHWMKDGRSHAGILLRRQGTSPGDIVRSVAALEQSKSDMSNRIEWFAPRMPNE